MKEFKNGSIKFDLSELNQLSIFAYEASVRYASLGCTALAKDAKEKALQLYAICEKHGIYKD